VSVRASILALLILGATAACASHGGRSPEPSVADVAAAAAAIRTVLDSTAAGWNRGDLGPYLAAYTDSATEMLSTGPTGGRDAIEKTMREGFWRTGRPAQQLRYEHLAVRLLGDEHALVTGQYVLSGGGRPDRSGWFTTIWARSRDGWRMIHDHS
jgi:uncharacterized protein (TIGR02246 family)